MIRGLRATRQLVTLSPPDPSLPLRSEPQVIRSCKGVKVPHAFVVLLVDWDDFYGVVRLHRYASVGSSKVDSDSYVKQGGEKQGGVKTEMSA